jgi:hypothetical protein
MIPKKREKKRGSSEAEWIPSKACSEAVIQSEVQAKATKSKRKRPIKSKKKEIEQRRNGERASETEWIASKACSEAATQSEVKAKATKRKSKRKRPIKSEEKEREQQRKGEGAEKPNGFRRKPAAPKP